MRGYHLFNIAGIPVGVSTTYIILVVYFFFMMEPRTALIWALGITVSLLVHELGHALVARRYRLNPRILLWGLGGLTFHEDASEDREDAWIIAAGPAAGLIFGALIFGAWQIVGASTWPYMWGEPLEMAFAMLLYINIIWSLVNLLPAWPLDGGQLFRLLMVRKAKSVARGERIVHGVGAAISAGGLVYALSVTSFFLMIITGLLLWQNVGRLRSGRGSGPAPRHNDAADETLAAGQEALERGDYREAARQGHVTRDYSRLSKAQTAAMWRLLGLATAGMGEYDEALAYLRRAPEDPAVAEAIRRCEAELHGS